MENLNNKLEELKKICSSKKETMYNLYEKVSNAIINKDISLLLEKYSNISNPKPNFYTFDNIEISINKALLEITDRRKAAFLWVFEVILNDNIRIGDAFEYRKKVYSVSYVDLKDVQQDETILQEIEKVIAEYDNSITLINENQDFTSYLHFYENSHEKVKCSDIFDVYNTVVRREPF